MNRAWSILTACAGLLLAQLVLATPADAAHAPPWRWKTTPAQTRVVEASTEEDIVIFCEAGYRPVSLEWRTSPRTIQRVYETYDFASNYGRVLLRNTNSSNASVTALLHCVHGEDIGLVDTNTNTIAHPVGSGQVGGWVDCDPGWGVLTGGATWDGFASTRRLDFSSPTETGWYATGNYPSSASTNLRVRVYCIENAYRTGSRLVQQSVHIPQGQLVTATAQCNVGERPVGTGAYTHDANGAVDPYWPLGSTYETSQVLFSNGAGRFTVWGGAPFPYQSTTLVARAWCAPYPRPTVTLTLVPPAVQSSHTVSYRFNATDTAGDALTLTCSATFVGSVPCANGVTNSQTLGEGQYQFNIRANNSSSAFDEKVFHVRIDSTPPFVTVAGKPADPTATTSASFTVSASDATTVTKYCRLDAQVEALCPSPAVYADLADGPHTFHWRAVDQAGNQTIGSHTWRVDTTDPSVTVTGRPPAITAERTASFTVDATDATGATSYCHLDAATEQECPVPAGYADLPDGEHTFHWRVVDAAGNETVGSHTWRVDGTAPAVAVTGKPAANTRLTNASFTLTPTDATATTVTCWLDAQSEQACSSPVSYTGLVNGLHTFHWRVVDAAGNETTGSHTWRVDTVAPTARLNAPTAPFQLGTTAKPAWSGSDGGSGVARWQLIRRSAAWNTGFGTWSAPASYSPSTKSVLAAGLARGVDYCWRVRGIDKAGNTSAWSGERCTALPLDDRSVSSSSGWTLLTGATYYAGTALNTTLQGASLTRTGAQLKRLALVATRCPSCGKVGAYVNGVLVGSVDLYRSTTAHRQLLPLPVFSYRTGTVTLKVLSTGKTVRIDGLGISRS